MNDTNDLEISNRCVDTTTKGGHDTEQSFKLVVLPDPVNPIIVESGQISANAGFKVSRSVSEGGAAAEGGYTTKSYLFDEITNAVSTVAKPKISRMVLI